MSRTRHRFAGTRRSGETPDRSGRRRPHASPPTINLTDPECDLDYVPDVGNTIAFGSKNSALVLKRV